MREVESSNVHSCLHHLLQFGDGARRRPDGADDACVAGCDWLLVDVQQTQVFQEGVGHAGVQLLLLDEGVWEGHDVRVTSDTS